MMDRHSLRERADANLVRATVEAHRLRRRMRANRLRATRDARHLARTVDWDRLWRTWLPRLLDVALITVIGLSIFGVVLGRIVPLTGRATFVVAGASMSPTIPLGAAVIVQPVEPRDLAVGDIVSLRSGPERAVFTHRIVRVAEREGAIWIETKGDANDAADPSLSPAAGVIGRLEMTIPYAGFLIALLSLPSGVIFVIALGFLLLMGSWFLELERPARGHAVESDRLPHGSTAGPVA